MQVTYYAERINGENKYFKVNTDRFGQRVAKIEIENGNTTGQHQKSVRREKLCGTKEALRSETAFSIIG